MAEYKIMDPFAGPLTLEGDTLDEAIETAYEDIPPEERPAYVWYRGRQVAVDGGLTHPVQ